MRMRAPVRSLAIASAIAISAATLTAAPAQAAPVFSLSNIDTDADMHDDESCTANPGAISPDVNDTPVTENGPAVTATTSAAGSVTDGALDTQTASSTITVSGSVASSGTNLKSIDLTAQGSLSVSNTVADSVCEMHIWAGGDLDFTFTVTQPGFMTFTKQVRGTGLYTEMYIYGDVPEDSPYHDNYGEGFEVDTSDVVYLPAGVYSGYFDAEMDRATDTAVSLAGKASMKGTFSPIGSQTEAAAGKGKKFVTLPPTARDCATDTVTASITDNKKRAKIIKKVKVFVNGDLEKKVKNPGRGDAVALTGIADGVAADVRAVVKLEKKANGKKRNPVEVTASYEACAPSA